MPKLKFNQLAQIAGQTPFYFYDKQNIQQTIEGLKQLFSSVSIYYAIKANPMPELVGYLSQHIDGYDVSSLKELQLALNSRNESQEICYAGPGKSEQELMAAVAAGIVINVESANELDNLIVIINKHKIEPKISLRINPDFSLKRSGISMTGYASAFGIDEEQIPELIEKLNKHQIQLNGFHIYSGSQNLSSDALIESHQQIFKLVDKLVNQYKLSIKQINIGGGFGIPYFKGDENLCLEPIADHLNKQIDSYKIKNGDCEFILELGRYLVGEAGYYVTKVIDMKTSKGKKVIIVDGGLHHHLANSGNFGQVIRKNFPILLEKNTASSSQATELVDIYGPLCTPLDIVAKDIELETIDVNDLIIVEQSGAYGKSASPENFLSHSSSVELLL